MKPFSSWRRSLVAGIALVPFVVGGGYLIARAQAPIAAAAKVAVGSAVPNFSVTDVSTGKAKDFAALSSGKKATVLIFVSVQCPVSNAYNERMAKIAEAYSTKGVAVVGINPNATESTERVVAHAKDSGFNFTVVKDEGNKVADQFNANVTPEVYVADAKGVLVYHGPIDDNRRASAVTKTYLTDALDAVLAGKAVPIPMARAFGCSIKRAK